MKRMSVGNLPFSSTEADVRALFSRFGDVGTINLKSRTVHYLAAL